MTKYIINIIKVFLCNIKEVPHCPKFQKLPVVDLKHIALRR